MKFGYGLRYRNDLDLLYTLIGHSCFTAPMMKINKTRNTLDCDQSNAYSSGVVFSAISQDLPFRSFSLYHRSASDSPQGRSDGGYIGILPNQSTLIFYVVVLSPWPGTNDQLTFIPTRIKFVATPLTLPYEIG